MWRHFVNRKAARRQTFQNVQKCLKLKYLQSLILKVWKVIKREKTAALASKVSWAWFMKKHTWYSQPHSSRTSSWSEESDTTTTTAYFVGYHPTFAKIFLLWRYVVEKRNYFKMVQYYYVFDLLLPILEMGRKSAKKWTETSICLANCI